MEKVTAKRWIIAQESEKDYWDDFDKETLVKEEIIRHKEKAKILEEEWRKKINLNKKTTILQIGCGPEDVINYFSVGKLYAVDPLYNFYKKKFKLDYSNITFLEARGETLPFKDNFFDVVILANVLDHVENPKSVLSEIKRIMKDEGIFHFENLFYQKSFIRVAKIFGKFKEIFTKKMFNIHHPYMFTLQDLKNMLSDKFLIIHEEVGREIAYYNNINELKKIKKMDKNFKIKIPAYLGLYGTINYIATCEKR